MNSYSLCGGFGRPKIGIDLAEIDRFRDPKRRERLLERAFTEREREYFKKKKDPSESVAAAFAAKEAFSKLLGTGVRGFARSFATVWESRNSISREFPRPYR